MRPLSIGSLAAVGLFLTGGIAFDFAKQRNATGMPAVRPVPVTNLRVARQSPSDLEVGGDLAGLPHGATRYITRDDLLALPQVTYTVTDDSNFTGPTKISGVQLEELTRSLGAGPRNEFHPPNDFPNEAGIRAGLATNLLGVCADSELGADE
jgi:hypothetical protein